MSRKCRKTVIGPDDLGTTMLGRRSSAKRAAERITEINTPILELDLSGCMIDYPDTSLVVDKVIDLMVDKDDKGKGKELTIITDLDLPGEMLIWLLFKKSDYANFPKRSKGTIREVLKANLGSLGVELSLLIVEATLGKDRRQIEKIRLS